MNHPVSRDCTKYGFPYYTHMEARITATELARKLGDVLGRVRYRGEVFVVERNGEPVARLAPVPSAATPSLLDGFRAWRTAGAADPTFADDLERIGAADRPARNPWD
jgi:prevent-host-death family protein